MLWGRLQTVKIKAGSLGYGQGPSQSRHGAKTFSGRYDSFLRRPSLPVSLLEAGLRMFSASPKTWATDLDRIFVHGDCVLRGLRHHDTGYRHHETQATDKSDKPRPTGKKTPWQRLRLRAQPRWHDMAYPTLPLRYGRYGV